MEGKRTNPGGPKRRSGWEEGDQMRNFKTIDALAKQFIGELPADFEFDIEEAEDEAFILDFAARYGVDPQRLYDAVQELIDSPATHLFKFFGIGLSGRSKSTTGELKPKQVFAFEDEPGVLWACVENTGEGAVLVSRVEDLNLPLPPVNGVRRDLAIEVRS